MSVPDLNLQRMVDRMKALGADGLKVPPPVFIDMETEIRDYRPGDEAREHLGAVLVARFPNLERYQNPMGYMQGGIIAAAVDGVVGPLSFLVAAPSVTAQLSMTYLAPVTDAMPYVEVEGTLTHRSGRHLVFDAVVRSPEGADLAVARMTQTVVRRSQPTS